MASPVSFGDVVAMSKLAWRIGHAFTKGRSSAPAEFREVENQLCSLSAALAAFRDACGSDVAAMTIDPEKLPSRFRSEEQDGAHTVSKILDSCYETLKHLEKIVDKYESVDTQRDPTKPRLRRWSAELIKNYKKIAWTTEAGDLDALRSQLMVHTNSLDLVLGIIVSSRTSRIEGSLRESSDMIKEIHSWWAQNLRDIATTATTVPSETSQAHEVQLTTSSGPGCFAFAFEVYMVTGGVASLLCPEACLHDDRDETGSDLTQLFICRCHQINVPNRTAKHPSVENITLSPLCFPFRQAGDGRSWTLFKALDKSSNRLLSITIKNLAASHALEFEESFIRPLAEARAASMMHRGLSNMLTHISPDGQKLRILNIQSDLKDTYQLVDAVSFQVGHRVLSKSNVEGLNLLNYRELGHDILRYTDSSLDHAELSIYYGQDAGESTDITKSVVHLQPTTELRILENDVCVFIGSVECLGFAQNQETSRLEKADVTFHMTSLQAAKKLYQRLEDMRMELFALGLQSPRPDETVVLHLQATEVQCEVVVVPDAELLVTRNRQDKYRLIVSSRNRCTSLTQDLADGFFASSASFEAPKFASPTWLVQLEGEGRRQVYHYPKGFKFLSFRSPNAERMFELGRTTLLRHEQGRGLPIREGRSK